MGLPVSKTVADEINPVLAQHPLSFIAIGEANGVVEAGAAYLFTQRVPPKAEGM